MVGAQRAEPSASQFDQGQAQSDDLAMIARAQIDPRAFAPLYAVYFDPVYRYCLRCLGDREAAADATQEVFARALAALPRYRDAAFRPWLFTIAHNVIVDSHRQRGRRPSEIPLEGVSQRENPAPSPEEEVIAAEERHLVRFYLAQLPPDQRAVIELRLSDLKGHEVAGVLARSLGSVKITQHRALQRLRELMRGTAAGEGERDGAC